MLTFEQTLSALFAHIHHCGFNAADQAPWSLCELQPGDTGLEMLRSYFTAMDAREVQRCLSTWRQIRHDTWSISYQCGFGLIFLLFAAETARRKAREGAVWPAVRCGADWRDDAAAILFVQGQPSVAVREAMEQAAVKFRLRHVFDREGVQAWLTTVYLQFGFTQRGFPERLPEWLSGYNQPQAIQYLLNPEGRRVSSPGFSQLWQNLRAYRCNNVNEANLRLALKQSPWILPEWTDAIINAARAQIQRWGTGGESLIRSASDGDAETGKPFFLSSPQLHWPRGKVPMFRSVFCNLAEVDLRGDFYRLHIDGEMMARLTRQENGAFVATPGDLVGIEGGMPAARIELIDSQAVDLPRADELLCWDESEEINVFELPSGRRFEDAWTGKMSADKDYALLLSADLVVHPLPADAWPVNWPYAQAGGRKLWRVSGAELAGLEVLLDGESFWSPFLQTPPPRPGLLHGIEAQMIGRPAADGSINVRIWCPPTYGSLLSVRINGQKVPISPVTPGVVQLAPFPMRWPGRWRVDLVRQRSGDSRSERGFVRLEIPFRGLFERGTDGRWQPHPLSRELSAHECATGVFGVGAPPDERPDDTRPWTLLEGGTRIGAAVSWAKAGRQLGRLQGWGTMLALRRGPFNADGGDETLADLVTDPGVFEPETHFDTAGGWLQIRLWNAFDLSDEHMLVVWHPDHSLTIEPAAAKSLTDGREIHLHFPEGLPRAVALAFRGERLGTWRNGDWSRGLDMVAPENAARVASQIRWLKLPVLGRRWRHEVKDFARHHPGAVLRAWLDDQSGVPDLRLSADRTGWLEALRVMLWNATGFERESGALIDALKPSSPLSDDGCRDIAVACWRLHEISPLLMGRVLGAWLQLTMYDAVRKAALRSALESEFAHLPTANLRTFLAPTKERLLDEAARCLHADSHFVDHLLTGSLDVLRNARLAPANKYNLQISFNLDSVRRLLALKVVAAVFQPGYRSVNP